MTAIVEAPGPQTDLRSAVRRKQKFGKRVLLQTTPPERTYSASWSAFFRSLAARQAKQPEGWTRGSSAASERPPRHPVPGKALLGPNERSDSPSNHLCLVGSPGGVDVMTLKTHATPGRKSGAASR